MPSAARQTLRTIRHKVFLVDDHPVTREGFAQLINYQSDLTVCGQAENAAEALSGVISAKPDVVVVDVSLQGASGIELIKSIRAQKASVPILVLSTHDEALYAERALRAGAQGYVMKQAPTREVLEAVRHVLKGAVYLSENMRDSVLDRFGTARPTPARSETESLTDRELEIFQLIGHGCGTRQIARRLNVSVSTVETHRAHIKEKLRLKSGMDLIRRAVEWSAQAQ